MSRVGFEELILEEEAEGGKEEGITRAAPV